MRGLRQEFIPGEPRGRSASETAPARPPHLAPRGDRGWEEMATGTFRETTPLGLSGACRTRSGTAFGRLAPKAHGRSRLGVGAQDRPRHSADLDKRPPKRTASEMNGRRLRPGLACGRGNRAWRNFHTGRNVSALGKLGNWMEAPSPPPTRAIIRLSPSALSPRRWDFIVRFRAPRTRTGTRRSRKCFPVWAAALTIGRMKIQDGCRP